MRLRSLAAQIAGWRANQNWFMPVRWLSMTSGRRVGPRTAAFIVNMVAGCPRGLALFLAATAAQRSQSAVKKSWCYRACHRAVTAHLANLMRASLVRLTKTASAMPVMPQLRRAPDALAKRWAVLGGAREAVALEEFGHAFGVALQMFDGNLSVCRSGKRFSLFAPAVLGVGGRKPNQKGHEYLIRRTDPDAGPLEQWLAKNDLASQARSRAEEHLARSYEQLRLNLQSKNIEPIAFRRLRALGEKVAEAYD
jgi:hypothetical protein